ncbi:MAG TPA: glycosyltransferase [Acidimicrobiales bacterium]|nr:glycosyltransferase [Acidimicrobiales bacterium]
MTPIRITHILPGLGVGGAERMLSQLVTGMDPLQFENRVISLTDEGALGGHLRERGVEVQELGMRRLPDPVGFARLVAWLRLSRPDIVQTWLYAADIVGGVAARMAGPGTVVWNIRQSAPGPEDAYRHRWSARTAALLSGSVPHRVLSCSQEARRSHERLGYRSGAVVIANGIDVCTFRPAALAAESLRGELRLDPCTPLVGMVARFDAAKGHRDFLEALAHIVEHGHRLHAVLCGEGIVASNPRLARWISDLGLSHRVHLLGRRHDVPRLLAGLDVAVSASRSEGFPNAVGEAMAAGVPCVATDVGDTALLLGDTGTIVPARDPEALAGAVLALLGADESTRRAVGARARQRIRQHFTIEGAVERYARFYRSLVRSDVPQGSACRT